jgi:hypothetical protein
MRTISFVAAKVSRNKAVHRQSPCCAKWLHADPLTGLHAAAVTGNTARRWVVDPDILCKLRPRGKC